MKGPGSSQTSRWRAQRKRRRAGISLEDAAITERTRTRYYAGLRRIFFILDIAHSWLNLDDRLATWISRQWERGEPLGHI